MIKGIIRPIDSLGRIVIPKEYRKVLGITSNDRLELKINDNTIEIRKYSHDYEFIKIQNIYYKSLDNLFPNKVVFLDKNNIYLYNKKKRYKTFQYFDYISNIDSIKYIDKTVTIDNINLDGYFIIPLNLYSDLTCYIVISTGFENKDKIEFISRLINNA